MDPDNGNETLAEFTVTKAELTAIVCTVLLSSVFLIRMFPDPFCTGSLKMMVALPLVGILLAPFAGASVSTDGGVRSIGFASIEKSSIASPSSAPEASKVFHLIAKLEPLGIDRPMISKLINTLFALLFPSSAPNVPVDYATLN